MDLFSAHMNRKWGIDAPENGASMPRTLLLKEQCGIEKLSLIMRIENAAAKSEHLSPWLDT